MKKAFAIKKDEEIVHAASAEAMQVKAFTLGRDPGPDPNHLLLDMWGVSDSSWNIAVHNELHRSLVAVKAEHHEYSNLPDLENDVTMFIIRQKCNTLQKTWRKPQPRRKIDGEAETEEEAVARYTGQSMQDTKEGRQRVRRYNVSFGAFAT